MKVLTKYKRKPSLFV